jgi:hypothetical protein
VSGLLAAGLPLAHRETLDGVPVTTKPRTVADLARTLDRLAAAVMADAALRAGVDRLDVLDVLATCSGWPGIQNAIDLVLFADRRAESALESLARVWFSEAGLPGRSCRSGSAMRLTGCSWVASTSSGRSTGPSARSTVG